MKKGDDFRILPEGSRIIRACPNLPCQIGEEIDQFGDKVIHQTLLKFVSDEYQSNFWVLTGKTYICTLECPKCGLTQKFRKKGDDFVLIESW